MQRVFLANVHWDDLDKTNMEHLISKVKQKAEGVLAQSTKMNISIRVALKKVETPENKAVLSMLSQGHGDIKNIIEATETFLAQDEASWKHADLEAAKTVICGDVKKINQLNAYLGML